jgi:UDP-N-acetylglucosamine--N-acetylmuramyl-(pentapeptide) pyrophosphoryl-undecaprenol N-acetylglucosamine transferase
MSARTPRIVIAAGGTGGHLFPGIAVAEALRARGVTELLFVSAGKGNWREALDKAGFAWKSLPVRGFGRRPSLAHLAFPFRLAAGIALSFALIASFRPAAVVGTGGYVSGPVVAAAWLLGVPVLLLEQNAFPGVSTRIASQFAREIHLAYPGSESFLPASARARARVTGNPIRGGVLRADRAGARAALGLAAEIPTLFLLGGSQGAIALNRALHEALARSAQERGPWTTGLQVIAQTGAHDERDWNQVSSGAVRVVAQPFFHDVGVPYAAADLLVCRAGATTLAEVTALGKPAILVPYPFAAADHQTHNAAEMARAGAAVAIPESDLTPARLESEVTTLLQDDGRRHAMAAASRALGRPDAADRVADALLTTIEKRGSAWNASARS